MFKRIWNFITGKKEEKQDYPYKYIRIELSQIAKAKGIIDDHNKIIKVIEAGQVVKEYPYTKGLLDALLEVDRVPIYEEGFNEDEEFEFYPFEDLGGTKLKK